MNSCLGHHRSIYSGLFSLLFCINNQADLNYGKEPEFSSFQVETSLLYMILHDANDCEYRARV